MNRILAISAALFLMPSGASSRNVVLGTAEILTLQGVRAQARTCRKMCPEDRNPCDPIAFKIADGRCSRRTRE